MTIVTVIYTLFFNPIYPKAKVLNFINSSQFNINFQMCLSVKTSVHLGEVNIPTLMRYII